MADRAYILSEREVQLLQDFIDRQRRSLVNPQARYHSDEQIRFAPDVYVARAPSGGIPGLVDYIGTGSGEATPGSAECDIYRLYDWGPVPGLVKMNTLTKTVWNISPSAVDPLSWILVIRDKFGRWFTTGIDFPSGGDTGTGTGTGTDDADCGVTVSWTTESVECEGGVLNVYSTTHYLYTQAGCLVLDQGEPSLARTEGYCSPPSSPTSTIIKIQCLEDVDIFDYIDGTEGYNYFLLCGNDITQFVWMCMPDGRCGWWDPCTCSWSCSYNCNTGTGTGTGTGTSTATVVDPNTGTSTDGIFFWWCVRTTEVGGGDDVAEPNWCNACCDGRDGIDGVPAVWRIEVPAVLSGYEGYYFPGIYNATWGTGCFWTYAALTPFLSNVYMGRTPEGDWTITLDSQTEDGFVQFYCPNTSFNCCGTNTFTFIHSRNTIYPWADGTQIYVTPIGDCSCPDDGILEEVPDEVVCVYSDAEPPGAVGGPWLYRESCEKACITMGFTGTGTDGPGGTGTSPGDLPGTGETDVMWWCIYSSNLCPYYPDGVSDTYTLLVPEEDGFRAFDDVVGPWTLYYVDSVYPFGCHWTTSPNNLGAYPRWDLFYIPAGASHSYPNHWQLIGWGESGEFVAYMLSGDLFNPCTANVMELLLSSSNLNFPDLTITNGSECNATGTDLDQFCVVSQVRPANAINTHGYISQAQCVANCGDTGTGTATGTSTGGECDTSGVGSTLTVSTSDPTGTCTCFPASFNVSRIGTSDIWRFISLAKICGRDVVFDLYCENGVWWIESTGCVLLASHTSYTPSPFQLVFENVPVSDCCSGTLTFTVS